MVACSAEVQLVGVHLVGLLGTAEWLGGRPGRSLLIKAAQLTCSMSQCSITCSMPAPFSRSTRTPLLNKMISCRPNTTAICKLDCLHRHADLTPEVTACGARRIQGQLQGKSHVGYKQGIVCHQYCPGMT